MKPFQKRKKKGGWVIPAGETLLVLDDESHNLIG